MIKQEKFRSSFIRHSQLFCVTCLVGTLSACGVASTSPSSAEIEKAVRAEVAEASEGVLSVVSFVKTDGLVRQDGTYVAEYNVDVKFDSCGYFAWGSPSLSNAERHHGQGMVGPCPGPGQTRKQGGIVTVYGVGYVLTLPGEAVFVKKESGWQLIENLGVLAETQYGLVLAPQVMRQKHLDHFMDIYRQFCHKHHSQEAVKSRLLASEGFRLAEDFENVFVEMFGGLSYGVTPDPEFCTVDVLPSNEENRLLFSQEDIETGVGALPGNYRLVERTRETRWGPDDEQVSVEVSEFLPAGSDGNRIQLVYPLSHQDVYYMALLYYYE